MNLDEVLARLGSIPAGQKDALKQQVSLNRVWWPNPGPQTDAVRSAADLMLYGGAGGGGKSDCALGLAFTEHRRSLIMRRQYTNLSGLLDRSKAILGEGGSYRMAPPPRVTTSDGRIVDFGAAARLGDEADWQGNPHDFIAFDEGAQFLEAQVRFLLGWNRTTEPGQRTRAMIASNPPLTAEGDWLIGMFRPWLDLTHHNPARPGELRWYVTDPDGKDFEVPGPEPHHFPGVAEPAMPQSRTFIPALLKDNPELAKTNYRATLDALPEPLRSAVRDGNFMLAREDNEWQVIPTAWIRDAQARWTAHPPEHAPMSCLAVDVAQGGTDQTVISIRFDGWYAPLEAVPGSETPDGPSVAGMVITRRRNGSAVVIDVGGGYGGSARDHLKQNGIEVTPFNGANASVRSTADNTLRFVNKRAETWWRFREALDPGQPGGSIVALPEDPELVADLTAPTFEVSARGLKIEAKDKIKERLGRSPDKGDAVVMAWSAGPKLPTHGRLWSGFNEGRRSGAPKVVMAYADKRAKIRGR